jgi:AcrR family transcriptional regulator
MAMTLKRSHILNTALSLFHQEGFSKVGVDRIIAEAEIAKMTFYRYFPTKLQLIEECLKAESLHIQISINEKLSSCKPYESLDKLKLLYLWHVELISSRSFNGCLFDKAANTFIRDDVSVFALIDQHKRWKFNLIRQQLIDFKIMQSDSLASLLVNVLDGMLVNARHQYGDAQEFRNHNDAIWHIFEMCLIQHKVDLSA